ncbi:DUF5694 domain-containing protein [Hymenobacter algoricola]|uniref:Uncharacterized protein n=1 Tax=Hymenobacter algoricola TaxID=486267 RepID=A0ABP7NFE0_9BACT
MFRLLLLSVVSGLALVGCTTTRPAPIVAAGSTDHPTDIWLLGCAHFGQLYKAGNPLTDVLTPRRQAELATIQDQVARFRPDIIMVEELPEQQPRLDSLYQRYRQGQLELASLPDGRSETYQLGFVLARRLGHDRVYCVNAPGGTSQSVLHQGTNIALYEQATAAHRAAGGPVAKQFEAGTLTLGGLLGFINHPDLLRQLHTLVYRVPARVTGGTLKPDPMVDASFVSPRHVGAEFISVMYNRDLKIYSNIVTTQLATRRTRILTIIGARHVSSLQEVFGTDPAFRVVKAATYLKPG